MPLVFKAAGVTLAYVLLGEISIALSVPPGFYIPVWPASGLAVAAVVLWGRPMLVPVALGTLLVGLHLAIGLLGARPLDAFIFSALAAAGLALQAEVGVRVMTWRRSPRPWTLESLGEIARITLAAGPAAGLVLAILLPLFYALSGVPPVSGYLAVGVKTWLSSTAGIIGFTPIILLLAERQQVSRRRKIAVALPTGLLLAIALIAFVFARQGALTDRRDAFGELAGSDAEAIAETMDGVRRRLLELGGLFAASESVTPDEFDTFVSIAFADFMPVADIRWAPRAAPADNDGNTERVIAHREAGHRAARFTASADGAGPAVLSTATGIAIPVLLDRALASGEMVVQVLPAEDGSTSPRLAVAVPGFQHGDVPGTREERETALSGLAISVFPLANLLSASNRTDLGAFRLHIEAIGETGATTLAGRTGAASGLSHASHIETGGLQLRLTHTATPDFLLEHQDWVSWAIIVIGLLFITLLNALILLSTARTDLVQRLVDRKTAEADALSENLALILQHAADGIMSIDSHGNTDLVNAAAGELLGYEPQSLVGKGLHDIIHPIDSAGRAHTREDCPMVSETRTAPVRNQIEPFRRSDGSSFPAELSSDPIFADDGSLKGVVIVFRDITRRLEAQAEKERFIAELSRANEELERFAFAASHDLQEPLRLVSNFNALLARRYGDKLDDAGLSYIDHSIRAAARMQALITDLLAYGRLNHDAGLRQVPVELADAVEEALRNLAQAIDASGARIDVSDLPTVRGNPGQLAQLMQNLIGNAIKYQPASQTPRVTVDVEGGAAGSVFRVSDNGIGIDEKYRDTVFQPFKRLHAKDEYSGTGMGLAICRKIVESHGGVIWLESTASGGSRFMFTLGKDETTTNDV